MAEFNQPGSRERDDASVGDLRLVCAARIVALVAAFRSIPHELAPARRAETVAVREQIYYGWERPLAAARGTTYIASKYEVHGWWSVAAAQLVNSGRFSPGSRQLEREHVEPVGALVRDLLDEERTVGETADLLDRRLVTCTVLASEHRLLRAGEGWQRYRRAGIDVQHGLQSTVIEPF